MSSFEKQAASKIKAASEKKDDVREFFLSKFLKISNINPFWTSQYCVYLYYYIYVFPFINIQSAKVKELEDSKKSLQSQLAELQKKVSEVSIQESLLDKTHLERIDFTVDCFDVVECQIGSQIERVGEQELPAPETSR